MSTFDNTSVTGSGVTGALWTGAGPSADFAISLSPSTATVEAGDIAEFVVTVAPSGGYTGAVDLVVTGYPPGGTVVLGASSITGGGTTTMTVYTADGSPAGAAVIAVAGFAGGITHSASSILHIVREVAGSIQVLLDGLDRTDSLYYQGTNSWRTYRGQRATCSLSFVIYPGSTFAPQIGQFLEVWDDGKRVWAGTVDEVDIAWLGDEGHHVAAVTGVGLEALFDGVSLDKIQYTSAVAPITCGAVLTDAFTLAAVPIVTLGTIADGPDVESLNVTEVKQAFDTLASYAGFIWYVDPGDLKLYFHNASTRAADWELEDGATSAETALFESYSWKQSRQDFADTWVAQLPGSAIATQTQTFDGDGATTVFTLDSVPQFVTSADISPIGTGAQNSPLPWTVNWIPGTNKITVTPAINIGWHLVVKWLDPGQVSIANTDFGATIGHRTRRYTKTRSFTSAGALQEATAALAQYALLPMELQLVTDKPGIVIGRKLTINVSHPAEASAILNGDWQVIEVDGQLVTGMDNLSDPWGHWRYTLYLVNFNATAIFQGDGATTDFTVPTGTAISAIISNTNGAPTTKAISGPVCSISPPPPDGSTVQVQYQGGTNPTTQPWQGTLEGMAPTPGLPGEPGPTAGSNSAPDVPAETGGNPQFFIARFTLRDSTVGNDVAPTPPAQHAGVGTRILGILKVAITADLTVRFNLNFNELITVTIPSDEPAGNVLEWPLVTGSPAIAVAVGDKDIWSVDILESDGQIVSNPQDMIAQFTVEWEYD